MNEHLVCITFIISSLTVAPRRRWCAGRDAPPHGDPGGRIPEAPRRRKSCMQRNAVLAVILLGFVLVLLNLSTTMTLDIMVLSAGALASCWTARVGAGTQKERE